MEVKYKLRILIDKIGRYKQYMVRGHSNWFALGLSIINFTIIVYKLLVEELYFIPAEIKSYWIFALIFIVGYFIVSTIVGYYDLKKGTYNAEQQVILQRSPIWRDLFTKLERNEANLRLLLDKINEVQKKIE